MVAGRDGSSRGDEAGKEQGWKRRESQVRAKGRPGGGPSLPSAAALRRNKGTQGPNGMPVAGRMSNPHQGVGWWPSSSKPLNFALFGKN